MSPTGKVNIPTPQATTNHVEQPAPPARSPFLSFPKELERRLPTCPRLAHPTRVLLSAAGLALRYSNQVGVIDAYKMNETQHDDTIKR